MSAFDNSKFEAYKAEAKERWGNTDAYRQHEEKTKAYSDGKWNALAGEMNKIFAAFHQCMQKGEAPASAEAQSLVTALQQHITDNYYPCTNEILAGLGQMYVADERFRDNIDTNGSGTAQFVAEAIEVYCK